MHPFSPARRAVAGTFIALALALVPTLTPSTAYAGTVIHVTTAADTIVNDGQCSLREAIRAADLDQAVSGCPAGHGQDTIVLPVGHYTLAIPGRAEEAGLTGDLDIHSRLTIRGDSAALTIVDAARLDRAFEIHHGADVRLDRLTITGGGGPLITAEDTHDLVYGGGISNLGKLLVTDSAIASNSTHAYLGGYGGGIYSAGSLTVKDSAVSDNVSGDAGGGIYATGNVYLIGDRISGNREGGFGSHAPLPLDAEGNQPPYAGDAAGITSSGYLVLADSLVDHNSGGQEWGHGGVAMDRGVIRDTTIRDNSADECGTGGVVMVAATMIRSTVNGNGNQGCGGAGGAYAIGSQIVNSTITGNSSGGLGDPGGIRADDSTIIASTIARNVAAYDGPGGLRAVGRTELRATIVAGNLGSAGSPDSTPWPDCAGTITSLGHNLIGDVSGCTFRKTPSDLIGVDARLGPLADNGGPTQTHMLRVGSPAIDAWFPTSVGPGYDCPRLDQRGVIRPKDGDGDGGAGCDIGAVERVAPAH